LLGFSRIPQPLLRTSYVLRTASNGLLSERV